MLLKRKKDPSFESQHPQEKTNWKKELLSWFRVVVLPVTVVFLLLVFVARPVQVNGASMENTFYNQDFVLVWELAYHPHRGDVVIVNSDNPLNKRIIKRVVALSGDTVEIQDGVLKVNGEVQEEPYLKEDDWGFQQSLSLTVPEGQVFVMGDNRNDSTDSRWIGPVEEDWIMGEAVFRIFPFDRFGSV